MYHLRNLSDTLWGSNIDLYQTLRTKLTRKASRENGRNDWWLYGHSHPLSHPMLTLILLAVGLIMGFIFGMPLPYTPRELRGAKEVTGGFNILRYGAGPQGPMRSLGQYMFGSAATFGSVLLSTLSPRDPCDFLTAKNSFFMSIGSVIRTEANSPLANPAFARAQRKPIIMPRQYIQSPRKREER